MEVVQGRMEIMQGLQGNLTGNTKHHKGKKQVHTALAMHLTALTRITETPCSYA